MRPVRRNWARGRVPKHAETRIVPYSPDQMFALVADVERYPEFLPWCVATRIRSRMLKPILPSITTSTLLVRNTIQRQKHVLLGC